MKFVVNTKPLKDALDLVVLKSNISKFYEISTVVELVVSNNSLRINTQSSDILSEVVLNGYAEDEGIASAIVDNILLKQLISTISDPEIGLEFLDTSLCVIAGTSKFSLPLLVSDDDGMDLARPGANFEIVDNTVPVDVDLWKYVRNNQLYVLGMSKLETSRIYSYVWCNESRGTLTGDPENGYFTYQPVPVIPEDCLISPSVINLLSSLSGEMTLYKLDSYTFMVELHQDSLLFKAQFGVEHENENDNGSYASDMIFDMLLDDSVITVEVYTKRFLSYIKQASLVSLDSSVVHIRSDNSGIYLVNESVNCKISNENYGEFETCFNLKSLDMMVSHLDSDVILISPIVKSDTGIGIRFHSDNFISLLGGVVE